MRYYFCAFFILCLNSFFLSKEFQGSLLFSCIVQFSRCCFKASSRLLYYITSFRFCQVLFSSFFKNFFLWYSLSPLALPPQVSLSIIPLSVAFVKPFFKISSKIFFSEFFLQLPSALFSLRPGLTYFLSLFFLDYRSRQLYHYITFFKVCQGNSFQDFHQKIGNISQ